MKKLKVFAVPAPFTAAHITFKTFSRLIDTPGRGAGELIDERIARNPVGIARHQGVDPALQRLRDEQGAGVLAAATLEEERAKVQEAEKKKEREAVVKEKQRALAAANEARKQAAALEATDNELEIDELNGSDDELDDSAGRRTPPKKNNGSKKRVVDEMEEEEELNGDEGSSEDRILMRFGFSLPFTQATRKVSAAMFANYIETFARDPDSKKLWTLILGQFDFENDEHKVS